MNDDKLTPRQERFCLEYASSGNATESYKAAYGLKDENTAAANWSRMLRNHKVQRRIRQLLDSLAEPQISSIIQVKAFWSSILNDTSETTANRLRASELLAKSAGAFLRAREADKVPASTGSGNWDDIIFYDTEAELEAALAARKDGDDSFVICLPRLETIVKDDEDGEDEEEP